MADVLKLQSTAGMFDYPDPANPSKGTTEQQYIEFEKNKHSVLSSLVADELWQPSTFYRTGQVVKSPNMPANVVARAVTNGTSANAEPVWSSAGHTMADGSVVWAMLYRTIDYATQAEVTAGTNNTKIVTPAMLGKTIKIDLASENAGTLNAADKTVVGGVTGILPVAHGGTGTDSLANVTVGKAGTLDGNAGLWDYLHRLGVNPTLPKINVDLNELGVFMSYFDQKDKIANQPTQYGQLLNIPADKSFQSTQLWIEQPTGKMFHRGGSSSNAINDTPFKRFLDTDDAQKWKDAYNALRKRSVPAAFDDAELTFLMNTPTGRGNITLLHPYTDFDGLLVEYTSDDDDVFDRHYISTKEIQYRIARSIGLRGEIATISLVNSAFYWYIYVHASKGFTTTTFPTWKENCLIQRIYGVKFKEIT